MQGAIAAVHVKLGQSVEAGEPLATLDVTLLRHELVRLIASARGANAEVDSSRVELQQAREQLDRRTRLATYFPVEEVRAAEAAEQVASARLAKVEAVAAERAAQVAELRARLARSVIRAPFGGRVGAPYCQAGDWVESGAPILRLISTEQPRIRFAVAAAAAASIAPGTRIRFRPGLSAGQESNGGKAYPAHVTHVAPEVDAVAGLVLVEGEVDDPHGVLAPGLAGRVQILVTSNQLLTSSSDGE